MSIARNTPRKNHDAALRRQDSPTFPPTPSRRKDHGARGGANVPISLLFRSDPRPQAALPPEAVGVRRASNAPWLPAPAFSGAAANERRGTAGSLPPAPAGPPCARRGCRRVVGAGRAECLAAGASASPSILGQLRPGSPRRRSKPFRKPWSWARSGSARVLPSLPRVLNPDRPFHAARRSSVWSGLRGRSTGSRPV